MYKILNAVALMNPVMRFALGLAFGVIVGTVTALVISN